MGETDTNLVITHHVGMRPIDMETPAGRLTVDLRRAYARDRSMIESLEAGIVVTETDRVILSFLMTTPARRRRQGIATRFVAALCASAERHGVAIETDAIALSLKDVTGALPQIALERFYGTFGFAQAGENPHRMVRHPIMRMPVHVALPTVIAAIIEGAGRDVATWIDGLEAEPAEEGGSRLRFTPSANSQRLSLDPAMTKPEHGLGRTSCIIDRALDGSVSARMVGGNFSLDADVRVHGPHPGDPTRSGDEAHHGVVLITGMTLPDTMMTATAGLPVCDVIRHPVLEAETIDRIDRIDSDMPDTPSLTRIWLKPSHRHIPMPPRMRKNIDRQEEGERS